MILYVDLIELLQKPQWKITLSGNQSNNLKIYRTQNSTDETEFFSTNIGITIKIEIE